MVHVFRLNMVFKEHRYRPVFSVSQSNSLHIAGHSSCDLRSAYFWFEKWGFPFIHPAVVFVCFVYFLHKN